MKLKLVKLFSFSINVLLSFSFLLQKGSLMKAFFRSSKRKFGIKLSSCDESLAIKIHLSSLCNAPTTTTILKL